MRKNDRRGNVAVATTVNIKSDFDLIRDDTLKIKLSDIVPSPGLGKSRYWWRVKVFDGADLLAESIY